MSSRISEALNKAIMEQRSCFGCINFKIKPFKFNELDNRIDIDFQLVETMGRCSKEAFNTNIGVRTSVTSKTNKSVILRDALKSSVRYRKMAENCDKYDGEDFNTTKELTNSILGTKKVKYRLVKYLF